MSDQTPLATSAEVKYLDKAGLEALWRRIKQVFPQTANLGDILDTIAGPDGEADPFTRKSYVDAEDAAIWTKLNQLEAATGSNYDGDTIVMNDANQLKTNLILDLDRDKKTIRLITPDIKSIDPEDPSKYTVKTIVSEIDYTPFIRDSFLDGVSVVVIPENEEVPGKDPGTYLKFVFNVQDEYGHPTQKESIYLPVDELGFKQYKGSQYISITPETDGYMSVSLNVVEIETLIEDYINSRSATITSIRTNIKQLQSEITGIGERVANLDKIVIDGYDDEDGKHIPSVLDQIVSTTQSIQSLDGRVTTLETWVIENTISESEINDITSNLN